MALEGVDGPYDHPDCWNERYEQEEQWIDPRHASEEAADHGLGDCVKDQ